MADVEKKTEREEGKCWKSAGFLHHFFFSLFYLPINAEMYFCTSLKFIIKKKHATWSQHWLFYQLVPKAHNSKCVKIYYPLQI